MRLRVGRIPPALRRGVIAVLVVALGLYIVVLGLIYSQQRRLLFPAWGGRTKAAEAGRALIVYFHGNGGSLWNRRARANLLTGDGRGLLMVSYRGYSGSTGSPSEAGLHLDAEAAYRWLGSYSPDRLVLYGESLGTGVAVRLATEKPVAGLILDAPYTSTADVARGRFPFLPIALLMRDQFRSVDRIARVHVPLLVMHGDRDGIIPIALSEALFKLANDPKRFVRLPGVDHVSVLEAGGLAFVQAFLAEVEQGLAAGSERPASPE